MTMTMVRLMAVTLMMAVPMAMVVEATMAIIKKNNDLIVIPMSRAPGSEDHNGDSMVVTMILKKKL